MLKAGQQGAEMRNCDECGRTIPAKRLAAIPDARFCVGCQVHHEEIAVAIEHRPEHQEDAPTFFVALRRVEPVCVEV